MKIKRSIKEIIFSILKILSLIFMIIGNTIMTIIVSFITSVALVTQATSDLIAWLPLWLIFVAIEILLLFKFEPTY